MKTTILVVLISACSIFLWAAENIQPLDVKVGLWEVTSTSQATGAPPFPAEILDKMTPEQRARFDAAVKAHQVPTTKTRKSCLTKEELNDRRIFDEERKSCSRNLVTSTSSKLEVQFECEDQGIKRSGTVHIEAINSENVKGSVQMAWSSNDRAMNSNMNFTAKWIGPDCGDTK